MPLTRVGPSGNETEQLQNRMAELRRALDERTSTLARAKTGLESFRVRYVQEVGHLHEQLDEVLEALADAELEIQLEGQDAASARATTPDASTSGGADASAAESDSSSATTEDDAPKYTSDAIRKLFRDVAKTIHPDLSHDEDARDQRHALMVAANRAYALGDLDELQRILDLWEGSPEAVVGSGPEAARERLVRSLARLEAQLTACDEELAELAETPLWRLKTMVDEASAQGKNLMADMVRRLQREILAARNRLDAIRWQP